MPNSIEYLESLPDINLLDDEGISLENIMQEMREDFERAYEEATGEEYILYPADPYRMLINVAAGQLYQTYEFCQECFKQNFIRYMNDDSVLHWGANLGYEIPQARPAQVELEFGLNEALAFDVPVPAGTRATAGDDVFFASGHDVFIPAGDISTTVTAVCTDTGTAGNNYEVGQLSTMADPVPYVSWVRNTTVSADGTDAPSGDKLKEEVYLFPSTYSAAGPEDAYIAMVKEYDNEIVDVAVIADDNATVNIYVLLKRGELPGEEYLEKAEEYLKELKRIPDTDHIALKAPETVDYKLEAVYYIHSDNKDTENIIKEAVEEAVEYYTEYQYSQIGMDIDPGGLVELARVAGAKRIAISSPGYRKLQKSQVAICSGITLEYGGLEG